MITSKQTKREHLVSRALVFKWHRRFADGQDRKVAPGRKKQYCAKQYMSIRESHAADTRLTIRELIEWFDMGYGTMHRILREDLQMSKVILSYKFDFYMYMMRIAKVLDHSYNIVNRNNQFKGMRFRSLQELQAATSPIVAQYGQQWYEDVFEQWIHHHRRRVKCEGHYSRTG